MLFKDKYGEAAVEVLDILDNTEEEYVNKIPKSFIKFLVDNASLDYSVNFDHSKSIDELDLKEETKELLGTIYIRWWSTKEQKEYFKKKIIEVERKKQEMLRQKYNPDNIFKKFN